MKTNLTIVALGATLLVACGPSEAEQKAAREKAIQDSIAAAAGAEHTYTVDPTASNVRWAGNVTGSKVYGHFGTVALNSGSFSVKGGQLATGTFEVNLKAITPLDSNYAPDGSKEGTKAALIGHLSTGDFFQTDSFPTATFKVTSVEGNTATGELTVKGRTNTEKVTDIAITEENGMAKATGKLVFDRQKYNVAWKHFIKDAVLSDNIELEISLSGKAAQ
ncbi:MAG: YceI family protein [Flavobacteriales bacterium]|nr:YceI family protein [Flavobacteriales bacterium]